MSLIDKLGGYDAAKKIVDNAPVDYIGYTSLAWSPSHGYALTHPFEMIHGEYYLLYIKEKLLEYRRQNNIFEVGDKVVITIDSTYTNGIFEVLANHDECIYLNNGERYKYRLIRHATDKEIAQGYRD